MRNKNSEGESQIDLQKRGLLIKGSQIVIAATALRYSEAFGGSIKNNGEKNAHKREELQGAVTNMYIRYLDTLKGGYPLQLRRWFKNQENQPIELTKGNRMANNNSIRRSFNPFLVIQESGKGKKLNPSLPGEDLKEQIILLARHIYNYSTSNGKSELGIIYPKRADINKLIETLRIHGENRIGTIKQADVSNEKPSIHRLTHSDLVKFAILFNYFQENNHLKTQDSARDIFEGIFGILTMDRRIYSASEILILLKSLSSLTNAMQIHKSLQETRVGVYRMKIGDQRKIEKVNKRFGESKNTNYTNWPAEKTEITYHQPSLKGIGILDTYLEQEYQRLKIGSPRSILGKNKYEKIEIVVDGILYPKEGSPLITLKEEGESYDFLIYLLTHRGW